MRFELLHKRHNRSAFDCGSEALDRYFHRQARQDAERGIAAVVVMNDVECDRVAGFFTLSATGILLSDLPEAISRKLPPHRMLPAMLIGRLAIDLSYAGQGLGGLLLAHALRYALDLSNRIGAIAVVVDAKDEAARGFYERHGFQGMSQDGMRLFMMMRTIERT